MNKVKLYFPYVLAFGYLLWISVVFLPMTFLSQQTRQGWDVFVTLTVLPWLGGASLILSLWTRRWWLVVLSLALILSFYLSFAFSWYIYGGLFLQ